MKKKVFIVGVMALLCCSMIFAKEKVNGYELAVESKLKKIITEKNLEKIYAKDTDILYKASKESGTDDWIFIRRKGSEEKGDKEVYFFGFAYVDGEFVSFTRYGSLFTPTTPYKYIYGNIDERSSAMVNTPSENGFDAGYYVWSDPQGMYLFLFSERINAFIDMNKITSKYKLLYPNAVIDRYNYFIDWINANYKDPKVKSLLQKEYKKYLKEHKEPKK